MAEREQMHGRLRTTIHGDEDAERIALRTADLGSAEGRREWADTIGALYGDMGVDWPNRLDRLEEIDPATLIFALRDR